jgi:hypothetical protein
MAIKVSGTTVIDDTRALTNITSATFSGALSVGSTPSTGTAGQVLTSAGAGAAPTWSTVSSGSSATLSDDTATNATYYPTFVTTTSGSMTAAKVSSTQLQFNPSTGMFSAKNFTSLSDATLKENVAPLVGSLAVLKQLDGVSYDWKDNGMVGYGFIAQEVEKVLPAIIATDDAGIKSIQYISLIAFLTEAVKELSDRVATLENK